MSTFTEETHKLPAQGPLKEKLVLRAFSDEASASFPLPDRGEVSIGRSREADIQLDYNSLSRKHAIIQVGEQLRISDLESSNGTFVQKQKIAPGSWVDIRPDEVFELGNVMMIVQRAAVQSRPRRVWSHVAFEARLEEAASFDSPFALIRLHVEDKDVTPGDIAEELAEVLTGRDCLATYATGEFELLMFDSRVEGLSKKTSELLGALAAADIDATIGSALFPRDGRNPEQLIARASAQLRERDTGRPDEPPPVIVADPAMENLFKVVDKIAQGSIHVLVHGETGVGKERIAEAVHLRSPRKAAPYVRLNCAALTETLAESELFGHEKGSFTGATKDHTGLIEAAEGGTLFLDEVGELPMSMQSKLLRVLEERELRRVGAVKGRPVDVRFIAATNRDLEEEITAGRFRRDLYFRLAGVTITVPPLRERPAEIEPLARAFAAHAFKELGKKGQPQFSPEALAALKAYPWPGNIRELRNVIERAALLAAGDEIRPEHLPQEKMTSTFIAAGGPLPSGKSRSMDPDARALEKKQIQDALTRCGGNQTQAARLLGISRRTLLHRLDEHGLPRPIKKAPQANE